MADFTTLGIRIDTSQVRKANADLDKFGKTSNTASKDVLKLDKAVKAAAAAFSVLALTQTTRQIVDLADSMKLVDARVRVATSSAKDHTKAMKDLVDISLRTGTSFKANATIFFRTNKAIESMGGSVQTTARFTETLAKSLVISGTTAGETTSVIRQMSQALASGVLRGDEFNSISENGARIQQLLSESLGVTKGELRTMAEHGELTSRKVINAIVEQSKKIDEEYAKMPKTVSRALENINTAFGQYIFNVDKGIGATKGIAEHLEFLADNMTPIIDTIVSLGEIVLTLFAVKLVNGMVAYGVAKTDAIALEEAHAAAIIENSGRTSAASRSEAIAKVKAAEATLAAASATEKDLKAKQSHLAVTLTDEKAILKSHFAYGQHAKTLAATTAEMGANTAATAAHEVATDAYSASLADVANFERSRLALSKDLVAADKAGTIALNALVVAEEEQAIARANVNAITLELANTETGFTTQKTEGLLVEQNVAKANLTTANSKVKNAESTFVLADAELKRITALQKDIPVIRANLAESTRLTQSELLLADATLAESEVTAANTNIHVANAVAKEAGTFADTQKARTTAALLAIEEKQVIVNEELLLSTEATTASELKAIQARNSLAASTGAATVATASLLTVTNALNGALVLFVAFKVGEAISAWTDKFRVLRIILSIISTDIAKFINHVSGWYGLVGAAIGATEQSMSEALDAWTESADILDELTAKSEKFAQASDKSRRAIKREADTVKMISEEREKAKKALEETIKSYEDEMKALDDEHFALLANARSQEIYRLSKTDYDKQQKISLLTRWDAIAALKLEQGAINNTSDATSDSVNPIQEVIDALRDENFQLQVSEEQYQLVTFASQGLTGAKLEEAMALWEANKAIQANNKLLTETAKLTASVATPAEKFSKTMLDITKNYNKGGISLTTYNKLLDKNFKLLNKGSDDVDDYSDRLKEIDKSLNDMGATSLDIFSGPADGINDIFVALTSMTEALSVNGDAIADNRLAWEAYKDANKDFEGPLKRSEEFYNRDNELQKKNTNIKIQGANIAGKAIIGMIDDAAVAAEEGSKKQEALQKTSAALTVVLAGVNAIAAIISAGKEGGIPGMIAMAAAVIPLAATIGATVASFSGGGGAGPSELQTSQGTGSVLGEDDTQSQSLGNSLELLEDYADIGNVHTSKMILSLESIDAGINNLGIGLFRSEDFDDFISRANEPQNDKTISPAASIFAGIPVQYKEEVQDYGILFGERIGDPNQADTELQNIGQIIDDGITAYYFARIDAFTSVGTAKTNSFTYNPVTEMEDSLSIWFQDIIQDIIFAATEGVGFLTGEETGSIIDSIRKLEIDIGLNENNKLSLKDLDLEESNEAIGAVFSKIADDLIMDVMPSVQNFQQVGEGLFETLSRIVGETENANTALSTLGLTGIKYTDVLYKQNDVGPQIVKQTILMNTQFDNVAEVMKFVTGDAEELVKTWTDLRNIQLSLIGTGLDDNINLSKLVGASGGESDAQSNLDSFAEDFFSPEEQFAINLAKLGAEFDMFNQTMPASKEAFKDLVLGIDATIDEGAILLANMLSLAPAVSELSDEYDELKESLEAGGEAAKILAEMLREFSRLGDSAITATLNSISDSYLDTLDAIIEADGTIDQMLTVVTAGIWNGIIEMDKAKDALNDAFIDLGKMFDDRQRSLSNDILKITSGADAAADAEKEYYEGLLLAGDYDEQLSAADALQSIIMSNYEEQIASVEDLAQAIEDIQGYIDDLLLNDTLTVLTPLEQLNEAERQFTETLDLARTGDIDALNDITSISDDFLDKARVYFASSQEYTDIFNRVIGSLNSIEVPDEANYDKINAEASQQAVSELEYISGVLDDIYSDKSLEFQQDLQLIDEAGIAVMNDFIGAVSSLTGYVTSDIFAALDAFASTNNIDRDTVYDFAGLEQPEDINPVNNQAILDFVNAGASAQQIYDASIEYSVTSAQLAAATGWSLSDINAWVDSQGLDRFAAGGITNGISIAGEAGPEAVVPLPDGRTIPVSISGNKSYSELIAEIKGLRADMEQHTGAIIETNYDANEQSSSSINTANKENTESHQWQNNKVAVV